MKKEWTAPEVICLDTVETNYSFTPRHPPDGGAWSDGTVLTESGPASLAEGSLLNSKP